MVEFIFTEEQRLMAFQEAVRRHEDNINHSRKGRNGAPSRGPRAAMMHLLGAAGELAVAQYLNISQFLYSDTKPIRGSSDLMMIDVKTRSKHYYDLLVQLDDDPRKKFVLVTIEGKKTLIHGWANGVDCMKQNFVKAFEPGRDCYAVPRGHLRPIEELKCLLAIAALDKNSGTISKIQY